jgi:tetratricopeptide (TPR) repeat protein
MNGDRWLKMVGACLVLALVGCGRLAQAVFLSGFDRNISNATQAIEAAHDDVQRAEGYSKRGNAYSEKARYNRVSKLIAADEYERLFKLAINDHGQAVALDQGRAEVYLNRGQAYYNRATLELHDGKDVKRWFDSAAADFETAIQKDARDYRAFDQLGVVHQENGEPEKAIEDFTKEMALNPLGKARLTDAYCTLASHYHGQKKYDVAVADYRKSIETRGGPDDGCACDPYEALVALYTVETRQYNEAWEVVHLAQRSNRRISPDLIERLKKDSGRRD